MWNLQSGERYVLCAHLVILPLKAAAQQQPYSNLFKDNIQFRQTFADSKRTTTF